LISGLKTADADASTFEEDGRRRELAAYTNCTLVYTTVPTVKDSATVPTVVVDQESFCRGTLPMELVF